MEPEGVSRNFHKTERRCGTGNKLLPQRFFFAKKKKAAGRNRTGRQGNRIQQGTWNPRKARAVPNRRGGRRKEHETGQTEPKGLRLRKRHWRSLDRVGRRAGSCDLPGALSACHDRMRAVCHRRRVCRHKIKGRKRNFRQKQQRRNSIAGRPVWKKETVRQPGGAGAKNASLKSGFLAEREGIRFEKRKEQGMKIVCVKAPKFLRGLLKLLFRGEK